MFTSPASDRPGEFIYDAQQLPARRLPGVVANDAVARRSRRTQAAMDHAVASTYGLPGLDGMFATFNRPHYMAAGGVVGRSMLGGPGGSLGSPVAGQLSIDVEGWRPIEGRCPTK